VNAGIGATRARHLHGTVEEPGQRSFQFPGDRPQLGLELKTAEVRAVVLDDDTVRPGGDR
jgi:hypothetical protein